MRGRMAQKKRIPTSGSPMVVIAALSALSLCMPPQAQAQANENSPRSLTVTPFACGDDTVGVITDSCSQKEAMVGRHLINASTDASQSQAGYLVEAGEPFEATS